MLLSRPSGLPGSSWLLLAGLLLIPGALEAAGSLRRVTAVGSSVLLPGLGDSLPGHSVRWEFLSSSGPQPILQHPGDPQGPAILAPFAGRALFHPSDGSLLLQDVQESDSGTYRVTAGAGAGKSLEIQLEVLQPVSRPRLRAEALLARSPGRVLCEVPEGRVDSIRWQKDGQPLTPGRLSPLSGARSALELSPARRSDCGSYSCNASNGVSWRESSLNVTIEGLSPRLKDALRVAVVAVVFALIAAWGLIIPVCQSEKLRIRGELWRWLSSYTCGLVCIACILDITTGILWMQEEGPSVAVILPEIALSYLTVVTLLVAITIIFQPTDFTHLKSKKEEGCTALTDVTILAVSTAAVSALPLLAIGLCYHTRQGWRKEQEVCRMDEVRSFEMSQPCPKDTIPS